MLYGIVYVGSPTLISRAFEEKFGEPFSAQYVAVIKSSPKYEQRIKQIKDKYERGMFVEALSSKRRRVAAISEIYDWCQEDQADSDSMLRFKKSLAKDCVMAVDAILDNKRSTEFNVLNLTQNNSFAEWSLKDIRREKAKLLEKLEGVKIKDIEVKEDS